MLLDIFHAIKIQLHAKDNFRKQIIASNAPTYTGSAKAWPLLLPLSKKRVGIPKTGGTQVHRFRRENSLKDKILRSGGGVAKEQLES